MPNQLSQEKIDDIIRLLGISSEIISFLNAVNYLLFKYSYDFHIQNEVLLHKKYKRFKKLSEQISELATFFEQTPIQPGEVITEEIIDKWIFNDLRGYMLEDGDDRKPPLDVEKGEEYLKMVSKMLNDIGKSIELTFSDRIKRYSRKSKNIDIENFTSELVSKFINCLKRLPVISPNSNDFIAFELIYDVMGEQKDRTKMLKNAISIHRSIHGKKGAYKVKLG